MSRQQFDIQWAEAAVQDLEDIVGYIAINSATNAEKVFVKLRSAADALRTLPRRGRTVPELARLGLSLWRELIVGPYRIVYRIDGHRVFVLAGVDSRRDLEDVLLERLVRP